MLDRKTELLLGVLKDACPPGGYTVISAEEIRSRMPESIAFGQEETERLLALLGELEYINLRFSEGGEYCLSVLPRGRNYIAVPDISNGNIGFFVRNKALIITAALSFAGAFIGAFLAGLIV